MTSVYRFEPTHDIELIRAIVVPFLPDISDDFTPDAEHYMPPADGRYLLGYDGEELLGMWLLVPHTQVCWEVHAVMLHPLKPFCGKCNIEAFRQMYRWVWANTLCRRIIACVPAFNRRAVLMASWSGMERFGVNPRAFLKGGKLHNVVMLGISAS